MTVAEPIPGFLLPPGVFLVDVKAGEEELENKLSNNGAHLSIARSIRASHMELELELELEGKETVEATVYPPAGFSEMVSCDIYEIEEEVSQRILKGGCSVVQKPPGVEFPSGMEIIRRPPGISLPAGEHH